MHKIFCRVAPTLAVLIFSCFALGDDFKSLTFDSTTPQTIRVHNGQFMVIRNFTQETGSTHSLVMVATPNSTTGTPVAVVAAAILDMPTVDVINNVVIAGPADVTFTCDPGGGNCFISFKKADN